LSETLKIRPRGRVRIVRIPVSSPGEPEQLLRETVVEKAFDPETDELVSAPPSEPPDDIVKVRREEYERGLRDGKRQAVQLAAKENEASLLAERKRMDTLLESFGEQFSVLYRQSEQALVRFSFGVAKHIIGREARVESDLVLARVKEGVARILGVEKIKIRVHPGDLELVRNHRDRIRTMGDALREVVVEADDHLEQGDCILESDLGNIDARIATQLKQVEDALFDDIRTNQPD